MGTFVVAGVMVMGIFVVVVLGVVVVAGTATGKEVVVRAKVVVDRVAICSVVATDKAGVSVLDALAVVRSC
jgi:hypothetical protein